MQDMATKFNEPTRTEIEASFMANSVLARAIYPLITFTTYERYQAHTWALRLIKAAPATGEAVAAALTNYDYMIEGAKAAYHNKPVEKRRCDAVLLAFQKWQAEEVELVAA